MERDRPQDPPPEEGTASAFEAKKSGQENATPISRPENPYLHASLLSKLLFKWPYPLMKLGMQRPLEESDLPGIMESDSSAINANMMERIWGEEKKRAAATKTCPSLHYAILRDFISSIWYVQPLMLAASTAKIVQALALGLLLETFESKDNRSEGYLWAGVLVLCGAVVLFEHHHVFFITWRKGMQLRIASVAAIYAKTLRLKSTAGIEAASSGRVMNIASNDVERFLLASLFVFYLFWAPVQSLAILALGIKLLGPAFAAGYGLLVCLFVPLQFYLSKRFATLRSKVASITDKRVTLVSQAVAGVRVMKVSGWEKPFQERIAKIRAEEVAQIRRANNLKALNEAVFFSTNIIVSVVVFLVHVALGGYLTPRNVYTTMVLVNIVQIEMTKHLSLAVMGVSEVFVSIKRIQNFLSYPELSTCGGQCHTGKADGPTEQNTVLISKSVTCYWNGGGKRSGTGVEKEETTKLNVALQSIDLKLGAGELVCVIGTVGSGKSALLQMLSGELEVASGSVERQYKSLGYASQDPWLIDGTIRENITMGKPFDDDWYGKVVAACGLLVDFEQFQSGDQTIVGDRGVQCSGGQRARIGLARALFRDSDVLLLDDPLSAVDAKVGKLLFYSAITNLAVERGKCVVLATHQHQFVTDQSKCVLMADGRIACEGTYEKCVDASGGILTKSSHNAEEGEATTKEEALEKSDIGQSSSDVEMEFEDEIEMGTAGADSPQDHQETKAQGVVRLETFLTYARAMGGLPVAIFLLLIFCVTQASVLGTIAALGIWSEQPPEDQRTSYVLGIVLGLGAAVVILALFRALGSFALTIKASQTLHDEQTASVLRATVEFFDTNPLGRILNRFSADVGSNDDLLPTTLFDFFVVSFICIGALITAIIVLPFTLVAFLPLMWYFIWVRRIFVTTTRELKRLEGLARSPIFAMLGEALGGIATIRSNGATDYFKSKFEAIHDAHSRAFFAFLSSSRWLGFRMDSVMFIFISAASFLAVLFSSQNWFKVDAAILGLALTMLLQLSGLFQWAVRQSAEVVNLMVSVERVSEFGHLKPEAALEVDNDAAADWPAEGCIEVKDLAVRYRSSLPLSLHGVSFRIEGGQRVGIVGRTGSGKSTMVQSLFRLLEAENGRITVDGTDISTLGLHKLRTNISVIQQVPVLFSGCSVRENLDPFHSYTDEVIRSALADVHMIDAVHGLPDGLNSLVAEGGSNFSVGQRQLLCLARAILRKNKILVLDEATANVDARTDKLLQEAIAKSFSGATIIAVAHRLDTVIDYDKILVLGDGQVLAYGTPHELASVEGGHFASMIDDTGHTMARELRRRASRASLISAGTD